MKRFVFTVLAFTLLFTGFGYIAENTGAKFRSDDRALELIRAAREAIGGDAKINEIRSLTIAGKATKTFNFDGNAKVEQGDWEMNLQLPNKLVKSLQFQRQDAPGQPAKIIEQEMNVVISAKEPGERTAVFQSSEAPGDAGNVVVVKKADGANATWTTKSDQGVEGKKVVFESIRHGEATAPRNNELFRTVLALLISSPEGIDVAYTYGGEASVDGSSCDIVNATTGESVVKLYLDRSSHLPRMIAFQSAKPLVMKVKREMPVAAEGEKKEIRIIADAPQAPEMAEFQVKFTDYRSVNGVQLPYKWSQTIAGADDETIDVTSYDLNPANIAEKFNKQPQRVMVRMKKPE